MRPLALAVLCVAPLLASEARAQYVDPMACLPPAGQGMWEIASTNLARRYREEPTAANKDAMCKRFRSTIDVYEKASHACDRSTCREAFFKNACKRVKDRVGAWRKRTKEECT